jgi:hypothetical protein
MLGDGCRAAHADALPGQASSPKKSPGPSIDDAFPLPSTSPTLPDRWLTSLQRSPREIAPRPYFWCSSGSTHRVQYAQALKSGANRYEASFLCHLQRLHGPEPGEESTDVALRPLALLNN